MKCRKSDGNFAWNSLCGNKSGCFSLLLSSIVNFSCSSSLLHLGHVHLAIGGADGKEKSYVYSRQILFQKHACIKKTFPWFCSFYFQGLLHKHALCLCTNVVHTMCVCVCVWGRGCHKEVWWKSNFLLKTALMKRDRAGWWRSEGAPPCATPAKSQPKPPLQRRIQFTQCT